MIWTRCFNTLRGKTKWPLFLQRHFLSENCCILIQMSVKCVPQGPHDHVTLVILYTLRWRHNGLGSISNHQPHDCLLNRLFRRRSKKTSKIHVTGLCAVNSPAENVSIWRRHHGIRYLHINSLSPMRFSCYRKGIIFKLISGIDIMSISCEIVLKGMSQDFNITSGNDLVPSGNKTLPGPVLT